MINCAKQAGRGGVTPLFVRGGEPDYTKVLIDGVPVNDAGGSYDFADLTADNVARVELIRGSQSAIYGSDAMTGVLQLFTHRGSTSVPEFEFMGEGGSFGFNRQFARLSGANGGFDYSASFTHLRTNGLGSLTTITRTGSHRPISAMSSTRARKSVLTARNEKSGLGPGRRDWTFFPGPCERAKRRRIVAGARLDDQTTNRWRNTLSFGYSESNFLTFDPFAQDLSRPDTPIPFP